MMVAENDRLSLMMILIPYFSKCSVCSFFYLVATAILMPLGMRSASRVATNERWLNFTLGQMIMMELLADPRDEM